MFKRIVNIIEILALVAAAVFFLLLFTNEPDTGGSAYASPGAQVFAENCARCHGSDGGGGFGPQLSGGAVAKDLTEGEEVAVVTKGRSGMPSFGSDLSPEQIKQVVAYTRTL